MPRNTKLFLLRLECASANEDCQKKDKFNECEGDQHGCLDLADSFWLTCHAVHSAVSNHAKADSAANSGESECEWEHISCWFS